MPNARPPKLAFIAFGMIAGGIFLLIAAAVMSRMNDVADFVPWLVAGVGMAELMFGAMLLIKKGTRP
ncbi:MAG: hypothetical protein IPK97_18735 [Ahniella sp.]|nr:hypothetical protein [Ahniella sp.]